VPAPKEILDLVARFELHIDAYKSGQYNETQLRRDFLDPFFKALGWDIDNSAGHAEAYRDVIHEDAVRIGDAVKAPDYGFRVGGQRQFFLEAKKPSVHIKEDIAPAFQLRRYAWSAKLPLSVLSDFEEFAIYDCRIKPDKGDKASVGRVFYCTFSEFAEKWDHIASIFSKDAVLKGSFDKFVEFNKAKRGTTEVDSAFLEEIEKWRADLASNLALRNKALTQRELNFAVQRIIDRIIFLRICEDRGIETYKRIHDLTEKAGIYGRLCERFQEADDRYNSGLFHFKAGKDRHEPPDALTLSLDIDDKLLRDILRGLYYPESPYEFSVLSADILGQVYEQFLGKVIELTESHRAKVVEKPEVRKAGGVFYTPTYIVDYIVRETVGKLLDECSRRRDEAEPVGTAGHPPRDLGGYEPRAATAVLERVSKLRILDPACGSGSFLIGAYQFLLGWHLRFYLANNPGEWAREKTARKGCKGQHPALVQTRSGGWQLSIAERKRILLNNIYGVDLDSQAVEVTKLSLLLKVLEGGAVQAQMSLGLLDRVLPDLGDNIKCGNSLIGHDFYQQEDLPALTENDRYRVNTFDWQKEFAEIFRDGGFDAVIGNPPWISIKGKFGNDIFLESELNYLTAIYQGDTYRPNIFEYFVRRAQELTKQNGFQSFIVPDRLGFNEQFTELRKHLASTNRIISLLYKAPFPNVTADTLVYVWKSKVLPKNNIVVACSPKVEPLAMRDRGAEAPNGLEA
jgi:predicted type IV restriction endonuclease